MAQLELMTKDELTKRKDELQQAYKQAQQNLCIAYEDMLALSEEFVKIEDILKKRGG